ncbi:hypothetical protein CCAX7_23200 [Capsulimonas corticalis]|uniref:Uncharacterized protein n=1 Tax=Capsulimonas corticalis TaxID=2219043 RepID=A0A402CV35_9BACT|nr:hypothetical protein [Capsulimonas corticalis]BDI30269.1 hypothetical protein CCAX7_23200 [Capsulimonas corticalis]
MQRSPLKNPQPPVWNAPVAPASAFMMCPAVCMMGASNQDLMLWSQIYQQAWRQALAQPRKLHVSAKDLPRSWRN